MPNERLSQEGICRQAAWHEEDHTVRDYDMFQVQKHIGDWKET